jgi:hypothetical protein
VFTSTATAFWMPSFAIGWHCHYHLPLLISTNNHQQSTMVVYDWLVDSEMIVEYALHWQRSFVCPISTYLLLTRVCTTSISSLLKVAHEGVTFSRTISSAYFFCAGSVHDRHMQSNNDGEANQEITPWASLWLFLHIFWPTAAVAVHH